MTEMNAAETMKMNEACRDKQELPFRTIKCHVLPGCFPSKILLPLPGLYLDANTSFYLFHRMRLCAILPTFSFDDTVYRN